MSNSLNEVAESQVDHSKANKIFQKEHNDKALPIDKTEPSNAQAESNKKNEENLQEQ